MSKFKDYFTVNSRDSKGILFLLLIILGLILYLNYAHLFYEKLSSEDFSEFQEEIDAFLASQKKDTVQERFIERQYPSKEYNVRNEVTITPFYPDTLNVEQWTAIGLSEKQAKALLSYRDKIGGFKRAEDLKRSFVVKDEFFQKINQYLRFPLETNNQRKDIITLVDLNLADSIKLTNINGIGNKLASRIVRYRELLGGFVEENQLHEVYGLSDKNFDRIISQIYISDEDIVRLNVNLNTVSELKTHPYIDWKIANSIVSMREMHGEYKSLDDIKKSELITEELFEKLSPYLEL